MYIYIYIYIYIYKIVFICRENMLGYLSMDVICSEKQTVFRERSSRKTVRFEIITASFEII